MLDLEQLVQWWVDLPFCLSGNIVSAECNSHWSIVVLAGFTLALLVFVLAGYGFFKVHRELRRSRVIQGARDIAATEKLVDEQARTGGERYVRELAAKHSAAFDRSSLAGWRIHGEQ